MFSLIKPRNFPKKKKIKTSFCLRVCICLMLIYQIVPINSHLLFTISLYYRRSSFRFVCYFIFLTYFFLNGFWLASNKFPQLLYYIADIPQKKRTTNEISFPQILCCHSICGCLVTFNSNSTMNRCTTVMPEVMP